jgi:alpha-ketoglutarate-dependent taurine dioxygenase
VTVTYENIKPLIGTKVLATKADLQDPEVIAKCRELLEERTVLVFPQIGLDDAEQLAFTDAMGPRVNFTSQGLGGPTVNDVYQVTLDKKVNSQPEYVLGTFFWHMDGLTVDMPPAKATVLSARKTSAKGGQTEFASTYAAYEHLPDDDKEEIADLKAIHSVRASIRPVADILPPEEQQRLAIGLIKPHPMVWTHESGRKSLVVGTTTDEIEGRPIPEGRALLARLLEWTAQPDFTYRHQWQEGDLVIWDNTGALHRVIPYDAESGRMMHRTSIAGTESVA